MTISAQKLERWTNYETAAINGAKETHQHIRANLDKDTSRLNNRSDARFDTLLQGSYANTTLVRGSGDVDILVRLTNPYKGDLSKLDSRKANHYERTADYFQASYSLEDFQSDVLAELEEIYGSNAVTRGNKAIEIDQSKCQLTTDADVVPCQEYRRYTNYQGEQHDPEMFYRGIRFFPANGGDTIINFPERHIEKGTELNDAANGNYKETIRLFKNARNALVEEGRIKKDDVPSYFIECLLSNVPSSKFHSSDLLDRFGSIIIYLQSEEVDFTTFSAQHGLEPLFGRFDETKWDRRSANQYIDALGWLYHNG
ncbi:nucleotidyltransferase [Halobaculum halobium]|uniref:Nucleotidyltransferase n=1 Tax=Halobaculum halobium TaxID=3032281 RepID=A0ABD5TBP0_9EURY|nr:hypothetical protein [Halobaculum sp. SYNS20]